MLHIKVGTMSKLQHSALLQTYCVFQAKDQYASDFDLKIQDKVTSKTSSSTTYNLL